QPRQVVPHEETDGRGMRGREAASTRRLSGLRDRRAAHGEPRPRDLAGQAELVEPFGTVAADACRQDGGLPGAGGDLESLKLLDRGQEALPPLELAVRRDVLPAQQKAHQILSGDRLDLSAEPIRRVAMDSREEASLAVLLDPGAGGIEATSQHEAVGL